MRIRTGIAALAMAGILAGCARNEETGQASVDAVTDSPNDYIGQTITIRGEVEELQNDGRVFTVEDHDWIFPEELLVITPRQISEMVPGAGERLNEDMQVRVTGTVRRLAVTEVEQEYGLDLDPGLEVEYRERPILVASAVELNPAEIRTGEELRTDETGMVGDTVYPGAGGPPPADSALLERDLPHTPAGDTTSGMQTDTLPAGGAAAYAPVTDVLLIIPVPGPRDLIGREVRLANIPLRGESGERGYWVGPSHSQRVFVWLVEGAQKTDLRVGETVDVTGTLQASPGQNTIINEWRLEPGTAESLIRNEALYIRATSLAPSGS